jgi:hypothetical protein
MLQKLDSPLRTYQQLVLQPAVEVNPAVGDGVQVLGEVPDDIAWVMPPPPATTGHPQGRRRSADVLVAPAARQDVVAAAELGLEPGLDPLLEITRSGLPNLQEWAYLALAGRRIRVRPASLNRRVPGPASRFPVSRSPAPARPQRAGPGMSTAISGPSR